MELKILGRRHALKQIKKKTKMRADMERVERTGNCPSIPIESPHLPQRLLDHCFPPSLYRKDEGIFIANTAKCGPASRSLPGIIKFMLCTNELEFVLLKWLVTLHMGWWG